MSDTKPAGPTIDQQILQELRRANEFKALELDLKAAELDALQRLVAAPRQRDFIEAIQHWWCPDPSACMRVNY